MRTLYNDIFFWKRKLNGFYSLPCGFPEEIAMGVSLFDLPALGVSVDIEITDVDTAK